MKRLNAVIIGPGTGSRKWRHADGLDSTSPPAADILCCSQCNASYIRGTWAKAAGAMYLIGHAAVHSALSYIYLHMYPRSRLPCSAQSIDLAGGDDAAAPSVCPASLLTIAEELHPRALRSDSSPNQPARAWDSSESVPIAACQGVNLDSAAAV